MALTISIIDDASDFERIAPMDYDAWRDPGNPQLKHFRVVINNRDEAIAAAEEKFKTEFANRDQDKDFWLKVEDERRDIIGAAHWVVNDPAINAEPVVAKWHPEGSEEKEFAERFINGLWGFLGARVTRKHMDLHSLVVHPGHRFRGAGRMLIKWGTAKADELGIETVISSLPSARRAYERSGLGMIEVIPPDKSLDIENPSQKWKDLQIDDLSGYLMWRPVGRDFVVGQDKAPWMKD